MSSGYVQVDVLWRTLVYYTTNPLNPSLVNNPPRPVDSRLLVLVCDQRAMFGS